MLRNLVANYAGAGVCALVPLLAVPVLIGSLGIERWGLIAFVNLMVAMMTMLNSGISQALVREFAYRWTDAPEDRLRAARLLRGYEGVYWAAALAIAACVLPFTALIADGWLTTTEAARNLARICVGISVVLFVATLPSSIYRGVLLAVQEHTLLNLIRTVATLAKVGGGVLIVLQTGSVIGYLIVVVTVTLAETFTMGILAWRLMPERRRALPFQLSEVRVTLRFSLTMSVLVVLGVATTQIDRIFVSMLMSVADLGVYSIAVSLAFAILQLSYPLFTSVMPALVAIGDDSRRRMAAIGRLLVTVVAAVAALGGLYWAFGQILLTFWLKDEALALQVAAPLSWLLLGAALNTFYNIGYTNWVSQGNTRWIAVVNILALAATLTVLPFAISAFGMVGATSSYIILNMIGAFATLIWMTRSHRQEKRR